ncbi:PBECR2 nuclease fold domain-containing protein [Serratia marcescens]|uniref:PBECR2 nuclease fold domain-containing protein n=1 Tax=Serratia marcescens TaxID=615 RepID=UPI00074531D8|nr:PBECR2 nuclease fold domain-containing protein [Serratia marcescens]CVC15120.1 Phage Mu protein F like protein [Serratia marcescens]
MAGNIAYGSLPFREQLAFFQRKLNTKTDAWTDVYGDEHDNEFMVAGANRDDLLADFRQAIERAIVEGRTLADFRKDFASIVARYGWSYNGGFEWRSRVIYETNLRSSYMAGRYQQLMAMRDSHPYWEYVHSDAVEEPREEHLAWNGMVLRWDDPWWVTHFPINAWGCQCGVIARTEDDLKRMGKDGPDTAPPVRFVERTIGQRNPGGPRTVFVPEGIDPGFEHTPGRSKFFSQVPPPRGGEPAAPEPPDATTASAEIPLAAPQPAPAEPWRGNAIENFLQAFGARSNTPAAFRDAAGQRIAIGPEMFAARDGEGQMAEPAERLQLLAQAILAPDEIWAQVVWLQALQRAVVRRRYLARFTRTGQAEPVVVVFETGTDGWAASTELTGEALQAFRQGVRLYSRGDE